MSSLYGFCSFEDYVVISDSDQSMSHENEANEAMETKSQLKDEQEEVDFDVNNKPQHNETVSEEDVDHLIDLKEEQQDTEHDVNGASNDEGHLKNLSDELIDLGASHNPLKNEDNFMGLRETEEAVLEELLKDAAEEIEKDVGDAGKDRDHLKEQGIVDGMGDNADQLKGVQEPEGMNTDVDEEFQGNTENSIGNEQEDEVYTGVIEVGVEASEDNISRDEMVVKDTGGTSDTRASLLTNGKAEIIDAVNDTGGIVETLPASLLSGKDEIVEAVNDTGGIVETLPASLLSGKDEIVEAEKNTGGIVLASHHEIIQEVWQDTTGYEIVDVIQNSSGGTDVILEEIEGDESQADEVHIQESTSDSRHIAQDYNVEIRESTIDSQDVVEVMQVDSSQDDKIHEICESTTDSDHVLEVIQVDSSQDDNVHDIPRDMVEIVQVDSSHDDEVNEIQQSTTDIDVPDTNADAVIEPDQNPERELSFIDRTEDFVIISDEEVSSPKKITKTLQSKIETDIHDKELNDHNENVDVVIKDNLIDIGAKTTGDENNVMKREEDETKITEVNEVDGDNNNEKDVINIESVQSSIKNVTDQNTPNPIYAQDQNAIEDQNIHDQNVIDIPQTQETCEEIKSFDFAPRKEKLSQFATGVTSCSTPTYDPVLCSDAKLQNQPSKNIEIEPTVKPVPQTLSDGAKLHDQPIKNIEIGRTFVVPENIVDILKNMNAVMAHEETIQEVYYDTVNLDLTATDYTLPQRNGKWQLSASIEKVITDCAVTKYREHYDESKIKTELSTLLDHPDDPYQKLPDLIDSLKFEEFTRIETIRKTFVLDGYTITLTLKDFGLRIGRIEMISDIRRIPETLDSVENIAKKLGFVGYGHAQLPLVHY